LRPQLIAEYAGAASGAASAGLAVSRINILCLLRHRRDAEARAYVKRVREGKAPQP
jgi:hypothetical protein